tara:strand:- start:248 stop:424 length:177 start_codon:yes stop_codon:yes gene_type:complete
MERIINNFIRGVKSFLFKRKMELKYKKPYKEILCAEIEEVDLIISNKIFEEVNNEEII